MFATSVSLRYAIAIADFRISIKGLKMNTLLKVLLLSLAITVGFTACSKKAEDAAKESAEKAKEAVTEMKATTVDAAKEAAEKTEAAAKEAAAKTTEAAGEAKDKAVDAVQAAKDAAAK